MSNNKILKLHHENVYEGISITSYSSSNTILGVSVIDMGSNFAKEAYPSSIFSIFSVIRMIFSPYNRISSSSPIIFWSHRTGTYPILSALSYLYISQSGMISLTDPFPPEPISSPSIRKERAFPQHTLA